MPFYDISIPLTSRLAVWPGDTPVSVERIARLSDGDSVNLGTLRASLHAGTHADAPYHFDDRGATIDTIPPEMYVGPALVWDVTGCDPITVGDLEKAPLDRAPRLLLRTGGWTDHTIFPTKVPVMAADVPAYLGSRGVRLLGLDVPSVDPIDSKDLALHHSLASNGIHILESLDLSAIETGIYNLSALPVLVAGADAGAVRAVLWN
jgi:arylformamidase